MKTAKQEKIKKAIYSVSALSLCAAALFGFWYSNKDNVSKSDESTSVITTQKETATEKEVKVNTPVENVKDDRYTTVLTTQDRSVYYAFPIESQITREFSKGEIVKNATTNDWRTHNGVDIAGTQGDSVKAICDGEVTALREDALWGTVLTVDHGNGIVAEYRGLEKNSTLKPGTAVKINEALGKLGEIPIEKADGIHLHIEIYKDGVTVSPSDYLGKRVEY